MLRRILLVFVVVQLADLCALIWIGQKIGFWSMFGLTFAIGMLGSALARYEGMRVWRGWNAALEQRRAPEEGVVAGMLVLLGAVLLVAPGFGTDILGLILLLPFTRRPIAALVSRRLRVDLGQPSATEMAPGVIFASPSGVRRAASGAVSDVIDTTGVESPSAQLDAARPPVRN